MKKFLCALVVLSVSLAFAGSGPALPTDPEVAPLDGVKSPDVSGAAIRFVNAKEKAAAAYTREVDKARQTLIGELNGAQSKLTRAADLESANKVKDTIEKLKNAASTPPAPEDNRLRQLTEARTRLMRKLHDTTWVQPDRNRVSFNAETMVVKASWHGTPGTWSVVDGDTIRYSVSMHDCRYAVMKLAEDGKTMLGEDGKPYLRKAE